MKNVQHNEMKSGSLNCHIKYLPLRNYVIKYPPPQIYVTICNKIVNPLPPSGRYVIYGRPHVGLVIFNPPVGSSREVRGSKLF